jgi:hypothetical protein
VTIGNIDPQDVSLNGSHESVDTRVQDDLVVNRDGGLQNLTFLHATTLRAKQEKVHGAENGSEEDQGEQRISVARGVGFGGEQDFNHEQ